jgi:polyhydroxyalkanoate synthesis regulator phasin
MTSPDNDLLSILGEIIKWLSAPLFGLVSWAWLRNQKEHDDLWRAHEKNRDDANKYVDSAITEVKDDQRRRSDKLAGHIERLFQNAEADRKEFSKVMADHREDSYKRHIELLHAINNKADKP